MKFISNLLLTVAVCLLFSAAVSAQQTSPSLSKKYLNVTIEKFTIRQGVEFPADKVEGLAKSIVSTLNKSKRFNQVSFEGDTATATTDAGEVKKLKISGEIIKYVKGNRAVRYMVGLGAGATKIITDVKFTDLVTGEIVHQQTVDGDVTWGLFGGDSDDAKSGVADEIIRVMKKTGIAGEKMKTK